MVVFIIRRIIKRSVILCVRRRKTAFPTPAHQSMTARNAVTVCVQPAMSRNFVTAAASVRTFPKRKHTATHMRAPIIIKRKQIRQSASRRLSYLLFFRKAHCNLRSLFRCAFKLHLSTQEAYAMFYNRKPQSRASYFF